MTTLLGAAWWFTEGRPVIAHGGAAVGQANVGPAKIDFAGTVSPLLATERAHDDDVVAGKDFDASRHSWRTPFAGDDEDVTGAAERLAGEVRHGWILGEAKAKKKSLVVDGYLTPMGCAL